MEIARRVVKWVKDNWEFIASLGLTGYVVAAWNHVIACFTQPCALWIGVPALAIGAVVALAIYHRVRTTQQAIRIVPVGHTLYWSLGERGGRPEMHVRGDFFASTHGIEGVVYLIEAWIEKPRRGRLGIFSGQRDALAIPAGQLVKVQTSGAIEPPPPLNAQRQVKATVVFLDHTGRRHKITGVVFEGPTNPPAPAPAPARG